MIKLPKITRQELLIVQNAISKDNQCLLLLDIDETLLNPLNKYQRIINRELNLSTTVNDIEQAGGLDNLYIHTPVYEKFKLLVDELRSDNDFNSNLPCIEGAIEGINTIRRNPSIYIGAYLTTRPQRVKKITKIDLINNNFPDIPIISRPDTIPRSLTTKWKLSILDKLSNKCLIKIIMIDDSIELSKSIQERNKMNNRNPIVSILYNGPLTHVKVKKNGIKSNSDSYFHIADWNHIPQIINMYAQN